MLAKFFDGVFGAAGSVSSHSRYHVCRVLCYVRIANERGRSAISIIIRKVDHEGAAVFSGKEWRNAVRAFLGSSTHDHVAVPNQFAYGFGYRLKVFEGVSSPRTHDRYHSSGIASAV